MNRDYGIMKMGNYKGMKGLMVRPARLELATL